jgi:hypothetical protein
MLAVVTISAWRVLSPTRAGIRFEFMQTSLSTWSVRRSRGS